MEVITLTNGKRVANFSSPHEFKFTDGSILPAVTPEEAEQYKVIFIETIDENNGDILLEFKLSDDIIKRMLLFMDMHTNDDVDVVIVPLPMLQALKDAAPFHEVKASPFRAVRIEDRINKLVSIDKQCI